MVRWLSWEWQTRVRSSFSWGGVGGGGEVMVECYIDVKNWYSSGYPAKRLALQIQGWDWLAWCQCTVTRWNIKFDLQLFSVTARKIEPIHHWDTLTCCWAVKQPTNNTTPLSSKLWQFCFSLLSQPRFVLNWNAFNLDTVAWPFPCLQQAFLLIQFPVFWKKSPWLSLFGFVMSMYLPGLYCLWCFCF